MFADQKKKKKTV